MQPDIQQHKRTRSAVRRVGAENYIILTLVSFAVSVSLTRLFLELTGYPQLGNSELHIAHVLWGGLLLYASSLLPLMYANRWIYKASAVLAGVGVGLFIDELGKFITQNNNYFYPTAAPIIYAFFLLSVLIYVRTRKPRRKDVRSELYSVFEEMEELLDHDLSQKERERIEKRLNWVAESAQEYENLSQLTLSLKSFMASQEISLTEEVPDFFQRLSISFHAWEAKWVTRRKAKFLLLAGLVIVGSWMLYTPLFILINAANPTFLTTLLNSLMETGQIRGMLGMTTFQARLGIEAAVGFVLVTSSVLIAIGRERRGTSISRTGLLIAMTIVNLMVFYFDQFSTIMIATAQLSVFIIVEYYRSKYLIKPR